MEVAAAVSDCKMIGALHVPFTLNIPLIVWLVTYVVAGKLMLPDTIGVGDATARNPNGINVLLFVPDDTAESTSTRTYCDKFG